MDNSFYVYQHVTPDGLYYFGTTNNIKVRFRPSAYKKEYYEKTKENRKIKRKEYYEKNKERIKEKSRLYKQNKKRNENKR